MGVNGLPHVKDAAETVPHEPHEAAENGDNETVVHNRREDALSERKSYLGDGIHQRLRGCNRENGRVIHVVSV